MKRWLLSFSIFSLVLLSARADTPPPPTIFGLKAPGCTGVIGAANPTLNCQTTGVLSGNGSDGLSIDIGTPVVLGGNARMSQARASSSQNGYLGASDWNTFNGKQAALTSLPSSCPMGQVATALGTTGALTCMAVSSNPGIDQETATNGGGHYTMTKSAGLNLAIYMPSNYTDDNFAIRLPDATTLHVGDVVQIAGWAAAFNQNLQLTDVLVLNNSGTGINGNGSPIGLNWNQTLALAVTDNTTANGTWQPLSFTPGLDANGNIWATNNVSLYNSGTLFTDYLSSYSNAGINLQDYLKETFVEMMQQSTPSNPPSGSDRLYFKSDGHLYSLNSGGTETQIGGANYTFTAPLVNNLGTITCNVASGSQAGCLSSANWTTFNNKFDTVGSFGSTPTPNGISVSGTTITAQPADASNPGLVSTGAQSFAGVKTFTNGLQFGTGAPTVTASGSYAMILNGIYNTGEYQLSSGIDIVGNYIQYALAGGSYPRLSFNQDASGPSFNLNTQGAATTNDLFQVQNNSTTEFNVTHDGKVGIGTDVPSATLQVNALPSPTADQFDILGHDGSPIFTVGPCNPGSGTDCGAVNAYGAIDINPAVDTIEISAIAISGQTNPIAQFVSQDGSAEININPDASLNLPTGDSFSATPTSYIVASPGSLTTLSANELFSSGKTTNGFNILSITASSPTYTCTTGPTFSIQDCGTSTSCGSPSNHANVQITASGTITNGSIVTVAMAAGHYWRIVETTGSCTVINPTVNVEIEPAS